MSLTSELRARGPLSDWFATQFPGGRFTARVTAHLDARPAPTRPGAAVRAGHWPAVGGAVGTRLAWAVEPAPPYYALFGSHNAGLIGWDDVNRAGARFPTHAAGTRPGRTEHALAQRPTPSGWTDIAAGGTGPQTAPRQSGTAPAIVADFCARAAGFLERVPPGGWGTRGEEKVLARIALVLTDWEQAYRGPGLDQPAQAALAAARHRDDAGELLAHADPAALADTTAVIDRCRRDGLLEQLADATGVSGALLRGHAFPVFAERWADGDLLLAPADGEATTLIDVKTVTAARSAATVRSWLHQLLGYAYLASLYCPEWQLGRVGLALTRHGHVVAWDLDELAAALCGGLCHTGAFARHRAGFDAAFRATLSARGLTAS